MDLKIILSNSSVKTSDDLIHEMLSSIGDTDPELRDKLIYGTFHRWVSEKVLDESQIDVILKDCKENLIKGLGEGETDTVFKRSFSAIICASILEAKYNIKNDMLKGIAKNSIKLMESEGDLRGYVQGKGWAHSIAHNADLIDSLINYSLYSRELITPFLNKILDPLKKGNVFIDDEAERISIPITSIILHSDTDLEINKLLNHIRHTIEIEKQKKGLYFYKLRTNFIAFLSALYFNLIEKQQGSDAQKQVLTELIYLRNL